MIVWFQLPHVDMFVKNLATESFVDAIHRQVRVSMEQSAVGTYIINEKIKWGHHPTIPFAIIIDEVTDEQRVAISLATTDEMVC